MRTEQEILDDVSVLEARYADIHMTQRHLRRFWEGHMWEDQEQMTRSLAHLFRDLRHGEGDGRDPDVRMTLPLIEASVSKFMALLTNPPQITMDTPPPGHAGLRKQATREALADQNEKFLYGLWARANVRRHFSKQGWYLPLMGSCFSGVHPDFKAKSMRFLTASPEHALPVWDDQMEELLAIGFKYEIPADVAARKWGRAVLAIAESNQKNKLVPQWRRKTPARNIEVIEWYDDNEKQTLVAGHRVQGVEHGLGYCPWQHTAFYLVPDEPFGKGIIEGNVPLFQKLNMLDSLELQAIIENVFSRLIIINPAMAPEDIDSSAGGVIPVGQGGDVKFIAPPSTTTDLSQSMARSIDISQKGTHLSPAMYGEGVASSITTGKAQHESTLPTGSMVEYVQGNIGDTWQALNEKAIDMAGQIFSNRKMVFFGKQFKNSGYLGALEKPERFRQEIKGSDLKGWSSHELSFQPLLSMHEKVVMNLQLGGAGLVSKRYQRDAIGIADNDQMAAEILEEQKVDIFMQSVLAMAGQGQVTPDNIERSFIALEKGGSPEQALSTASSAAAAMAAPAPAGGGAPAMPPPGADALAAAADPAMTQFPPELASASNPGDTGLGQPDMAAGAPEPQPGQFEFTLSGAVGDFSQIKKLKDDVWLVGEIVQRGGTDGPVEVMVADGIDKATIKNGLPDEYHGNLLFHVRPDGPQEPSIQVGPGHDDPTAIEGADVIDHPDDLAATEAAPQEPGAGGFQDQAALANFEPPLGTQLPAGGFTGSMRSGGTGSIG